MQGCIRMHLAHKLENRTIILQALGGQREALRDLAGNRTHAMMSSLLRVTGTGYLRCQGKINPLRGEAALVKTFRFHKRALRHLPVIAQ